MIQPQTETGRRLGLALLGVVVVALITAGIVSLVVVTGRGVPSGATAMSPAAKLGVDATASERPAPGAHAQSPSASATSPATTAPSARTTTHPAKHADANPTSRPRTTSAEHPRPSTHMERRPSAPKTYTVQRGDTLSGIAHWFHMRGYGTLYTWNKSVIGRNPNLIFPGQTITVTPAGRMTVGR